MAGTSYPIGNVTFYEASTTRNNLRVVGPAPWIAWEEDDQTDPAGRFRVVVTGDSLILQRAATADFATFSDILTLVGATLLARFAAILEITGGQLIRSSDATEIGIQVTNSALTVGTLGSLVIPVKTGAGAPNDAEMGNLVAAMGFNSADSTLEVRTGVDTFISVGLAGYVIQRRVPELEEGWYHRRQHTGDGQVDETRCAFCGDEMKPGDEISLYANGRVRNDDLHCVFVHTTCRRQEEVIT